MIAKNKKRLSFKDALAKARRCVENHYGCVPGRIPWRLAKVDPFGKADYRAELHLMEGTPPKGFVMVCRYNFGADGQVIAFDLSMNRLANWKFHETRSIFLLDAIQHRVRQRRKLMGLDEVEDCASVSDGASIDWEALVSYGL